MLTKPLLAAARVVAAVAAFLALPALAQQLPPGPVCANCHAAAYNSTVLTAHGAKNDANGTMCMTCHGDATAHVKDPYKVKPENRLAASVPAADKAGVCLTCHAGNRQLQFWQAGKHSLNEVACSNCHSIHGKAGDPAQQGDTPGSAPSGSGLCPLRQGDIDQQVGTHGQLVETAVPGDVRAPVGWPGPDQREERDIRSLFRFDRGGDLK